MADPVLIACLKVLRAEFKIIAPDKATASDGWIGDTAHQQETSDHNDDEVGRVPIHDADHIHEVHAVDVDSDLRTPGLSMERVVQFILARCRSGAETRLRYVIYNRRIWEASNDWRERPYTGASAHTEHAHFSASYDTAKEASTASWHLEGIPVALTDEDKAFIKATVRDAVEDVASEVWGYQLEDPTSTATPRAKKSAGAYVRYADALAIGTRGVVNDARQAILAALDDGTDPAPAGPTS